MAVKLVENGKYKNLYLKGVKLFWVKARKPEKGAMGDERQWSATVFVSEKDKDQMEDMGVNKTFAEVDKTKIKKGKNKGNIKFPSDKYEGTEGMFGFNLTLKEFKSNGEKNRAPTVVLKEGKENVPFKGEVGNGTVANVRCGAYTTQADPDALCLNLNLIQIIELVEYSGGSGVKDDELGIDLELEDEPQDEFEDMDDDKPPFDTDEDGEDY